MSDRTICVIDDDAAVLKGLSRLLKAWGFCVQAFPSAQQFLQQLTGDNSHIGCLLLDVYMPGMSGVELRALLDRAQRRFPIIFLTGVGGDTLRHRAMADGALCVLEKPFDDVELRRAVEDALLLRSSG
jgi:two-component system, LuxR family, response regulator FixJ